MIFSFSMTVEGETSSSGATTAAVPPQAVVSASTEFALGFIVHSRVLWRCCRVLVMLVGEGKERSISSSSTLTQRSPSSPDSFLKSYQKANYPKEDGLFTSRISTRFGLGRTRRRAQRQSQRSS